MRSPKPLWPRTQDLDARQRTESQAARKGLVSGPAGGRDVSGAPAGRAAPSTRAYQVAFFYSCLFCAILVLPARVDRVVCRGDGILLSLRWRGVYAPLAARSRASTPPVRHRRDRGHPAVDASSTEDLCNA